MPVVKFTGHPLADVGVATLCALRGKGTPDALTVDDLDKVADELSTYYFSGLMTSYLSCVFMNAEYVQPGKGEGKDKARAAYEERVLRAHRWRGDEGTGTLRCAYSHEPATHLVHRSQVPMLTGQDVLNFFPAGRGALPVAGPYLLAIQALPMGGRRAEGKLLFAHSDDPELTIQLAKKYVDDNRRLLNLARTNKLPAKDGPDPVLEREHGAKAQKKEGEKATSKYPDAKGSTSLVAFDLLDISLAKSQGADTRESSVIVYVMSNSGQGPSLEIHTIPSQLVRFLRLVGRPPAAAAWRELVSRSWRNPQQKEGQKNRPAGTDTDRENQDKKRKKPSKRDLKAESNVPGGPGRSRNDMLADLFPIFDAGFTDLRSARDFIRRHLLRDVRWNRWTVSSPTVPRRQIDETSLVDWNLTGLFLREVMGMDTKRVEKIRDFANKLADHIATANDKSLFQDMVFGRRQWEVRNALTKAQRNEAKDRGTLLFGLQDYLDVFEADDAVGVADWSLTRDLVSIRLVEALHQKGFFKEKRDWLENAADTDDMKSL